MIQRLCIEVHFHRSFLRFYAGYDFTKFVVAVGLNIDYLEVCVGHIFFGIEAETDNNTEC